MDDGEKGDGSRGWRRRLIGWSAERLQLAAGRAVDDVPAAIAQLPANGVCRLEITRTATLDPLVEKTLRVFSIQSAPCARPASL